jgi:hypothetical protein
MHGRILVVVALTALGCAPRVGNDCPPAANMLAHTIVHRRDGLPAYAGQALMITSCGGGSFCHSPGSTQRYGAPHELDLVPTLADQTSNLPALRNLDPTTGVYLRDVQVRIVAERDDIYASVYTNSMPPGAAGDATQQQPYVTFDAMGAATPIPGLDTAIGRETLRNWLACGAPVIERTGGLSSATRCSADADCPLTGICDLGHLRCVAVGDVEPYLVVAIEPTWPSIYEVVIQSRCASSACHGGASPPAGLSLSDREDALATLLSADASASSDCQGQGRLVVPGDPDASLLYRKLTLHVGDPMLCGGPMPSGSGALADRYVTAIRDWIAAGAMP